MKSNSFPGKFLAIGMLWVIAFAIGHGMRAQTGARKTERSEIQPNSPATVQELVQIETGFFEAWRTNDEAYLREHMADNGILWGEGGVISRDQQLSSMQEQSKTKTKTCNIQGFGLSDFGALPLSSGAYLLTYKAEQYGTCNGEKLPLHINGSSIYILKAGRWQAIYRASVPQKNES